MEIRVAIFEDNDLLRESLADLMNLSDDLVCTGAFPDANKLIRNIDSANPDVVLMDLDMPGISGIEAVQIIKIRYPKIKVLIQTVFDEDDKVFAAICAGASGYMLKSTSPRKMIEAVIEIFKGGAPMTASVANRVLVMFRERNHTDVKTEFIDLSEREKQILALLVQGKSYKAVASECYISVDTVSTHIRHIYEKLQVHSKSEAVVKAINQRLI